MSGKQRRTARTTSSSPGSAAQQHTPTASYEEPAPSIDEGATWLDGASSYLSALITPNAAPPPTDSTATGEGKDEAGNYQSKHWSGERGPTHHDAANGSWFKSETVIERETRQHWSWKATENRLAGQLEEQAMAAAVEQDTIQTKIQHLEAQKELPGLQPLEIESRLTEQRTLQAQTEERQRRLLFVQYGMRDTASLQAEVQTLTARRGDLRRGAMSGDPALAKTSAAQLKAVETALEAAYASHEASVAVQEGQVADLTDLQKRALATRRSLTSGASEARANRLQEAVGERAPLGKELEEAKTVKNEAVTRNATFDVLSDDPTLALQSKRDRTDGSSTLTSAGLGTDGTARASRTTTRPAADGGSVDSNSTSGELKMTSDTQSGSLTHSSGTTSKTPGGPSSSSSFTGGFQNDAKGTKITAGHSTSTNDGKGSSTNNGMSGALLSNEDGNGVELGKSNSVTMGDAAQGPSATHKSSHKGTLTDRKIGYAGEQSTTSGGAGQRKVETKTSQSGSYQADIFQDAKTGLWKLVVTVKIAAGAGASAERGDAAATGPDDKNYGNQGNLGGGASLQASTTLTKTRLLTDSEKASYLHELEQAERNGATDSSKAEVKHLARFMAGAGEVDDLVAAVSDPSSVDLAEGESLEMSFDVGGGLDGKGSAGGAGLEVSGKGTLQRTVKIERVAADDGSAAKPVEVTVGFASSTTVGGTASATGATGSLKVGKESSSGSGASQTFKLDSADTGYNRRMQRILGASDRAELASLAKDEDLESVAFTRDRNGKDSHQVGGGGPGKTLGIEFGGETSSYQNIKADLEKKSLVGSKVGSATKATGKVDVLGGLATADGGLEVRSEGAIGDEGFEGSMGRQTTDGMSFLGGMIGWKLTILDQIDLNESDLAALVGRASVEQTWNGRVSHPHTHNAWQRLGRRLRNPAVDEQLANINREEARTLARAEAIADFLELGGQAEQDLRRAMHDYDGWEDIGVDTQFVSETTFFGTDKDTDEGLKQSEWKALKKARRDVVTAKPDSDAHRKAVRTFSSQAADARKKLQGGVLRPRARMEMLGRISELEAEVEGSAPSKKASVGPSASETKQINGIRNAIAACRADESTHLQHVADELDSSWLFSANEASNRLAEVYSLYDAWDAQLAELKSILGKHYDEDEVKRRARGLHPRRHLAEEASKAIFGDYEQRLRIAAYLRSRTDG